MATLNREECALRIKSAMKTAGISPGTLAEMLGVSNTTVSLWRNGAKTPGIDSLLSIADITGVEISYLLPANMSKS